MMGEDLVEQELRQKQAMKQKKYELLQRQQHPIDPIQELQEEIKERQAWLNEMETLGCAQPYRPSIQSEIQIRMNQVEQLQRKWSQRDIL
jgi:phage tail tape-measure protein